MQDPVPTEYKRSDTRETVYHNSETDISWWLNQSRLGCTSEYGLINLASVVTVNQTCVGGLINLASVVSMNMV